LGDMDFKIAGTKKGITAVQLDMKLPGIPLSILIEALKPALAGRIHILDTMEKIIFKPREDLRENIPRRGEFSTSLFV
jgi:polyribonucleotide nucleotidyltransferase